VPALENIYMSMVVMTKIGDDIFILLDNMKIAKRGKDWTRSVFPSTCRLAPDLLCPGRGATL
jgi:hypothetical protein